MTAAHQTANAGVALELSGIVKRYPGQTEPAVKHLDLQIPAGEMVMLVGPSGCGKTTTLKMINRLIEPTEGRIRLGGEDVTKISPTQLRRRIGYVIQGGALLPHMTVAQNIGLVPGLLKWPKDRIRDRVDTLLDLVGLDPETYRDRWPRELSGGQQQRVGVARGLAADPPVVFMDEPFGAVDPITRSRLQDELMGIQSDLGKTIVCVTHDIDEAIKLGDRVAVFGPGAEVEQYDTPQQLLANPANEFVADFIGSGSQLKQLALRRVNELELIHPVTARIGDPAADVVSRIDAAGTNTAVILDERDRPREWLNKSTIARYQEIARPEVEPTTVVDLRATLRDALDAMLASSHGGVMVTEHGRYQGVLLYEAVAEFIRDLNAEGAVER